MNLKEQRAGELKAARTIAEKAQAENRDLTTTERDTIDGHLAESDRLKGQIEQAAKSADVMARISALGWGTDGQEAERAAETRSALKAAVVGRKSVRMPLERTLLKAPSSTVTSPNPVHDLGEMFTPTSPTIGPSLRELFNVQLVDSAVVRYYAGGVMGMPQITAEGELKTEMMAGVEPVDAPLVKLAGYFKITMELDQDASFVVDKLIEHAAYLLMVRENTLILDTMTDTSGVAIANGSFATAFETLAGAIGAQESAHGITPSRIVINPMDLAKIRSSRANGSGDFIVDPMADGVPSLFGTPVMPTPSAKPGQLWLMNENAGVFYQREQNPMVQIAATGDDLLYNKSTVVVEERVLPAIIRPNLITKVNLTD